MGEYYNWVNVDKKEYIRSADFDYGSKFHESMGKNSRLILALHTLLNDLWKGDRVIWFGDECGVSEQSSNQVIQFLYYQSEEFGYPGSAFDMICESYRNVSCLFKEAEEQVREQIGYDLQEYRKNGKLDHFNEYGIDFNKPFDDLFFMNGRRYQYTINHTKKIYYSLDETVILYKDGTKDDCCDPLPILMGFGRVTENGAWLGDRIAVSNNIPEGYRLIKRMDEDLYNVELSF